MYKEIVTRLLLFSLVVSCVLGTEVNDCRDGTVPQPIHVEIKGCDQQPCPLVRGEDVIMIMNFTATEPTQKLTATVLAQPEGTSGWVTFPLPRPNVCEELINTHCPLEVNEPGIYKLVMPVLRIYPKIPLRLEMSINHNGGSEQLVCFSVNCLVV